MTRSASRRRCALTVGPELVTSPVLHRVRQEVIRRLARCTKTDHAFCWVMDFPLFEPDRDGPS
jgi:aspartyl-tRNA synthetase